MIIFIFIYLSQSVKHLLILPKQRNSYYGPLHGSRIPRGFLNYRQLCRPIDKQFYCKYFHTHIINKGNKSSVRRRRSITDTRILLRHTDGAVDIASDVSILADNRALPSKGDTQGSFTVLWKFIEHFR